MEAPLTQQEWENQFFEFDKRIRAGGGVAVGHELARIPRSSIPRKQMVNFANLGRRLGMPYYSIHLLNQVIHPLVPLREPATAEETAVYASVITRIGAFNEATSLLRGIGKAAPPEAHLFLAYIDIYQWNYLAAIPHLRRYLKSDKITAYQRLIAQVNLAAAMVAEWHWLDADPLLNELESKTRQLNATVLLGNILELKAQAAIARHDHGAAKKSLGSAAVLLRDSHGSYPFYVKKWTVIAEALLQPKSSEARDSLLTLRREAEMARDWESTRDLHLYLALVTEDQDLLRKVVLGTPFPRYHYRIRRLLNFNYSLPKKGIVEFTDQPSSLVLDVPSGILSGRESAGLKPKKLLHRTLLALTRDLFKPIPLGEIHSLLYPGEYYNPQSSPARVKQAIQEFRQWVAATRAPVRVAISKRAFKLHATAPLRLLVARPTGGKITAHHPKEILLYQAIGNRYFTSAEAASIFGASVRTARRLLLELARGGGLQRRQGPRKVMYRLSRFETP